MLSFYHNSMTPWQGSQMVRQWWTLNEDISSKDSYRDEDSQPGNLACKGVAWKGKKQDFCRYLPLSIPPLPQILDWFLSGNGFPVPNWFFGLDSLFMGWTISQSLTQTASFQENIQVVDQHLNFPYVPCLRCSPKVEELDSRCGQSCQLIGDHDI